MAKLKLGSVGGEHKHGLNQQTITATRPFPFQEKRHSRRATTATARIPATIDLLAS